MATDGTALEPTLYVVHCVDAEGPLSETLEATFERIRSAFGVSLSPSSETLMDIQNQRLDLGGKEAAIARMVAPGLLAYNDSWDRIRAMLDEMLSQAFRRRMVDDAGNGWVYSWHCVDHLFGPENPRNKDIGYGKIFRFYRQISQDNDCANDELNWHFHPTSITGSPIHAATSYTNSYANLNEILCRRILEDAWFPVVNRPGFHSVRPDSHAFLEQWIPFDYANQRDDAAGDQPDLGDGRFGDWRRAPTTWRGYNPSHDDYQLPGNCHRTVFRCLNVGTRLRTLQPHHVRQAFDDARSTGAAILAFTDHDYRDMRPDVESVRAMIRDARPDFPEVKLKFSGAGAAARALLGLSAEPGPRLSITLESDRLVIRVQSGRLFGPQPFLALKARNGRFHHDNLDVQVPGRTWTYTLDAQTIPPSGLVSAGVGSAGNSGGFDVATLEFPN